MRIFALLSWSALALLSVSPLFAANAPGDAADKAEAVAKKKLSVAHIEITGGYSEGVSAPGLFGDVVETLGTALQRLDKAARDESLDAIILHISDPSIGSKIPVWAPRELAGARGRNSEDRRGIGGAGFPFRTHAGLSAPGLE